MTTKGEAFQVAKGGKIGKFIAQKQVGKYYQLVKK